MLLNLKPEEGIYWWKYGEKKEWRKVVSSYQLTKKVNQIGILWKTILKV